MKHQAVSDQESQPLLQPNSETYQTILARPSSRVLRPSDNSGEYSDEVVIQNVSEDELKELMSGMGSGQAYHCHTQLRGVDIEGSNAQARRTLIAASVVCLLFMIAEVIGGTLANSLAIITDAAHLLTDFASFLISLFSLWVATMKPSKKMSFGWHRAEVLGALVSVLLIWMITAILVWLAVQRVVSGDYEINAVVMLITAGVGVLVNIIMGLILHYGGHAHSHGGSSSSSHGHAHEAPAGDKPKTAAKFNLNVRAAFIHVLGDLCQSVGVFFAALIIYFRPDWKLADPICTFLFSVLVLITTLTILRDTMNVLMEGIPRGISFGEVLSSLRDVPGVQRVHNLRIWALTMEKVAVSVHLAVNEDADAQNVLYHASIMLERDFGVFESTIQIETFDEQQQGCDKCETPDVK